MTYYAVLCKNGDKTDGVLYSDKKKAEASCEAADKQAFCKDCSPHRIIELVDAEVAEQESTAWLEQTSLVSRALNLDPAGDMQTRIRHQLERIAELVVKAVSFKELESRLLEDTRAKLVAMTEDRNKWKKYGESMDELREASDQAFFEAQKKLEQSEANAKARDDVVTYMVKRLEEDRDAALAEVKALRENMAGQSD